MNDERLLLPFKLLTNEWHPKKSWLAQVKFLRKELGLQDQVVDIKLKSKKPSIKKSVHEEFEMAFPCKSKLQAYTELKGEIGFEKYLLY